MDSFELELNGLLVETFRTILKVEETAIKSSKKMELSISEIHMLEAVGKGGAAKTISELAQDLGITLSSVTIAIGKLEKKGYVQKNKASLDGRAVNVSLTPLGRKIDRMHRLFHLKMVSGITEGMSDEEKQAMLHGIAKLNEFFEKKIKSPEA